MQVSIRLYRQHDMDLIRMYMNKAYRFTSEMRNALIAYANNRTYVTSMTDTTPDYKGYLRPSILIHISINEKNNPEVIRLFEKLKKGQRNAFIKTVMRRSIAELPLSAYFEGDGIIMSKEKAYAMNITMPVNETNLKKDMYVSHSTPSTNIQKNASVKKNSATSKPQESVPLMQKESTFHNLQIPDNEAFAPSVQSQSTGDNIPFVEDIIKNNRPTTTEDDEMYNILDALSH